MSQVPITPGSGAEIATDLVSGANMQVVKLDGGAASISEPILGTTANGLLVDVSRIQTAVPVTPTNGATIIATDGGGSLTVDFGGVPQPVAALATAPVAVRLSNGTIPVDTLPVSGAVTASQGNPNTAANAWFQKLTDGTTTVGVTGTSLNVNLTGGGSGGAGQADESTFTQGTTDLTPVGGVYTSSPANPTSGQAAAVQITQKRAFHSNLRDNSGVEVGTSGNPLRIDPVGTTAQTSDITKIGGVVVGPTNALIVTRSGQAQTRVSNDAALVASTTAGTIVTPASGKKFAIRSIIITITVTGTLSIFDAANTNGNRLYKGTPPVGLFELEFGGEPWVSSTADNILKYTSGTGLTGDVSVNGFEI